MIENSKELDFKEAKTEEDIDKILQEKLGTGLLPCKEALFNSVSMRSKEIVTDTPNIAPYGNYDKLLEDKDQMATFLQTEASKVENWKLEVVQAKEHMVELMFFNTAVDEGDVMKGFVYLGFSGKIRHAFANIR